MIARLQHKLRRLSAAVPVLIGALIVTGVLSLVGWLVAPHLPEGVRNFVAELAREDFETRKNTLKAWFDGFGAGAALVFLFVQFLQVVVAPIPGQFVGVLGGFVFGFWKGLLLNVAGNAIGSLSAILLTRVLGKRFMRPFVPAQVQEKFDEAVRRGGLSNFFMLFLLPGTPKDSICFMAGMTRIAVLRLLAVNSLCRLPGLIVLTFTGAAADNDLRTVQIVFGVGLVLALLVWLFDEEIKERLKRLFTNAE